MSAGTRTAGPTVRSGTQDDLAELVRLDGLAREHIDPQRGGAMYLLHGARPAPVGASLLEDLDDPGRCVLVGLLGQAVVGYAIAALVELRDGSVVADVSELFVEPPARCVGVGEALMDELVVWARRHGCIGIDARALPGDRATKNFFESFGLVARAITVHRDLRTVEP